MTSLAFVSLLLVTMVVSTASAQGGIASCCRKLSNTQIQRDLLTKYYEQYKPQCPIYAVVFTTLKGKRICADPDKVWTKTSKAYLDGKESERKLLIRKGMTTRHQTPSLTPNDTNFSSTLPQPHFS